MAYRSYLMVCGGTGCVANQSMKIRDRLKTEIEKRGLQQEISIVTTGCNGFCAVGPLMVVQPEGIFYQLIKESDIPRIVEEHLIKGQPVKELLYTPPGNGRFIPRMVDIPFFSDQSLVVLRNRGLIDPERIDEAIGRGAYEALAKVLTTMKPEEVIAEIKASGLRGRGGGGFPTGIKWETCRNAPGDPKYVICNADEGDPGAFMDRSTVESDPHAVIEGMCIGGYAVGSTEGYVYIRNEYPIALERLTTAIRQAREKGLLGKNIFDKGFDFDIRIIRGAPGEVRPYRGTGTLGQAVLSEQRGDVGQCSPDYPEWRQVVCQHRNGGRHGGPLGRKQRDQGLLALRKGQQYRTDRSPNGYYAAQNHL